MDDSVPFKSKVIVGSKSGSHLVILGGVHGDEYEPMVAIRRLSDSIESSELTGRVTLVPVLNEPAFERKQRVGPDQLDLARTFPGNSTGSITEQIAHSATELIRGADYLIDLHTGGLAMRVLPMVGYMLHSDEAVLDTQRRMAHAFNLPIVWGTSSELDGRTLSVARDDQIPAIYAEWQGGGGCHPQGVKDYLEGCLNVMASLDMIERPLPNSRVKHRIEDARKDSGHLQINYNSNRSGYFEPAVHLDDHVGIGDTLGRIVDVLGETLETITSTQKGIVLVLRVLPAVEPGDSLAVILEPTI